MVIARSMRFAAPCAAALILCACATSHSVIPTAPPAALRYASASGTTLKIVLPVIVRESYAVRNSGQTALSAATKSVRLSIDRTAYGPYRLAAGATGCATRSDGLHCTLELAAPSGAHTVALTTLCSFDANKYPLAVAGNPDFIIRAGRVNVLPKLTWYGLARSIHANVQPANLSPGMPGDASIAFWLADVKGAPIPSSLAVGPHNKRVEIQLSLDGPYTHTYSSTLPPAAVKFVYDGDKSGTERIVLTDVHGGLGHVETSLSLQPHGTLFRYHLRGQVAANIIAGTDGNLWVAGSTSATGLVHGIVDRVTPSGSYTAFRVGNNAPYGMVVGPDHRIWYSAQNNVVGAISKNGKYQIYTFNVYPSDMQLAGLTIGPDGNLWIADVMGSIVRADWNGHLLNRYMLPLDQDRTRPVGIVTGADGELWFSECTGSALGRITTDGSMSTIPIGAKRPYSVVLGHDGNVWFGDAFDGAYGWVSPARASRMYDVREPSSIYGMAVAPDGTIWFADNYGAIGHIDETGNLLDLYTLPKGNSGAVAVAIGPDGNVWYAGQDDGIGKIALAHPY